MPGRECHHCKQWIEEGEAHDCWTTTEGALTEDLSEDLREAWERIRETAASFGEQRIYASGRCIMFSRRACYFFVRPKRHVLELSIFLGHPVKAPQVRRSDAASRVKVANILHVTHRDEVEPPITDWMLEAYETSDALSGPPARKAAAPRSERSRNPTTALAHGTAKKKTAGKRTERRATTKRARKRAGN